MPVRTGKCINFGSCNKADSREVVEVAEGAEFVCPEPECGKPLQPNPPVTTDRRWLKLGAALLAGVLTVCIASYVFLRGSRGTALPQPAAEAAAPAQAADTACDFAAMEQAHRNGDCALVVKIGEACAAKAPNDATVLNNLATGLMKCGDTRRAVELLGRAIEAKPDDPYFRYNLACAVARSGDQDGAVGHLRRACQLGLAPATFRQDPDLKSLAGFPAFEELIASKCQ